MMSLPISFFCFHLENLWNHFLRPIIKSKGMRRCSEWKTSFGIHGRIAFTCMSNEITVMQSLSISVDENMSLFQRGVFLRFLVGNLNLREYIRYTTDGFNKPIA